MFQIVPYLALQACNGSVQGLVHPIKAVFVHFISLVHFDAKVRYHQIIGTTADGADGIPYRVADSFPSILPSLTASVLCKNVGATGFLKNVQLSLDVGPTSSEFWQSVCLFLS